MRKVKVETHTHKVEQYLRAVDDFVTNAQLRRALPGVALNQLTAALHHLHKRHAVSFIEAEGCLWWYATPNTDDRTKVSVERAIETKPRKPRKPRKV